MSHRRYLIVLGTLFAVVWAASAINPSHPADWLLENVLVALFIPAVILYAPEVMIARPPMRPAPGHLRFTSTIGADPGCAGPASN